MITDKISNITKYKSLINNFKYMEEFIKSHDLKNLPYGKTKILGDDLYVNVFEYELSDFVLKPFESHRQYIDIHFSIKGEETLSYSNEEIFKIFKKHSEYNKEDDTEFFTSDVFQKIILNENNFVIFLCNELHIGKTNTSSSDFIKKAVFKIKSQIE